MLGDTRGSGGGFLNPVSRLSDSASTRFSGGRVTRRKRVYGYESENLSTKLQPYERFGRDTSIWPALPDFRQARYAF
jgi:hypothetical protein